MSYALTGKLVVMCQACPRPLPTKPVPVWIAGVTGHAYEYEGLSSMKRTATLPCGTPLVGTVAHDAGCVPVAEMRPNFVGS
jgi:hypothetical protein